MHCPNCNHILTKMKLGSVEIDHCNECGGTLFDANEINRITLEDAEKLASLKEHDIISGTEKFSPNDGSPFERLEGDSIPQHVTILQSKSTGEVFTFPDDLVNFKKAQNAKLSYFKAWNIPVPALTSVLVYSFILVTSVSLVYFSSRFQSPTSTVTKASDLCINSRVIEKTDASYQVFCETKAPLDCEAEVFCPSEEPAEAFIPLQSDEDRTAHFGFVSLECENVRIVCADGNNEVETEWMKLNGN